MEERDGMMIRRISRATVLVAPLLVLLLTSCGEVLPSDQQLDPMGFGVGPKATGDVQIMWMGGNGGGAPAGEEKLAYADIAWFDTLKNKPDRSRFHYLVYSADGSLHREIVAEVSPDDTDTGVAIDGSTAYFVGKVTFDSKSAAGGHEGESGGETGCEETTEEGGCGGGEEEEEGGCSGGHEDEGSTGPRHPPGSTSRVGQIVAVVVDDGGTPGTNGDTLRWSWFADPYDPAGSYAPPPSITDLGAWPELCDKPILGGNLVTHP